MSTAVFELAISIPGRVKELNTLVEHASECEQENEPLYNALCRATAVLLASHLEGFIKELTSALVADLNFNSGSFNLMPAVLQRTFCERIAYYEGVQQQDVDDRIQQLIAFFSENSVPIDLTAISYKQNPNKNPTANLIDGAFRKLGVPEILGAVSGGRFDVVFDNDKRNNYLLLRDLVRFRSCLYVFPYRRLPTHYSFKFRADKSKSRAQPQSLWLTFIEGILVRRHKVAHGDTLDNDTTWEELALDITKLQVLMQGLMYAATTWFASSNAGKLT
jgi:hypothetical protein